MYPMNVLRTVRMRDQKKIGIKKKLISKDQKNLLGIKKLILIDLLLKMKNLRIIFVL